MLKIKGCIERAIGNQFIGDNEGNPSPKGGGGSRKRLGGVAIWCQVLNLGLVATLFKLRFRDQHYVDLIRQNIFIHCRPFSSTGFSK